MIPGRSRACPREADVLEAVSMGRWPECGDADLAAHVASCPTCTDVAGISFALQRDRRHLAAAAPVPASAIVWWRAQRRAREEAARTAGRPITIVQSAGLVCGAMAVIAVLAGTLPIFARWFDGLGQLLPTADAAMSSGSAAPSMMSWVWPLALGAGLVLASVAVYFAVREEP